MHQVIRMIVEADSRQAALTRATTSFEIALQEVSGKRLYDYAVPMERGLAVAGRDRWPEYAGSPLALLASTPEGEAEITAAWENTTEVLTTQESMDLSDDDLVSIESMPRELWYRVFLFEAMSSDPPECSPIVTDEQFTSCLAELTGKWVVPLDVHF